MSTATARITLDEYHEMAEKGLLRPDSKDYLWRGEIVEVMTRKPPHISTAENLMACLRPLYTEREWTIREEKSLPLPDDSEPLPDIVVLRGLRSSFYGRYPRIDEIELLVEVAHTSLKRDLGEKRVDYAAAGVARYWVADVENVLIIAFWDPDPAAGLYRASRVFARGQSAEAPNGPVRVDDVFAHLP